VLVVRHDGVGQWRRSDGAVERSVALGVGPSGPPAADRSGGVYVPAENGELAVVCPNRVWRVTVASVALGEPRVDADRGQVLVVSGSGVVAAVAACPGRRQ
jgi:hypothetical protein